MARAKALVAGMAVAALVAAAAVSAATTSTPSLTIQTPRAGNSFSKTKSPTIKVSGTVAFATAIPVTEKLYLRRDGCGSSNDNPHLSVAAGTDAGTGCGFVGGNGLVSTVSKGLFSVDYPSTDGMPVTLDTSQQIDGVLDLQNDAAGAGQVTLDFTLEALVNGEGVIVGTDTETVTVDPTTSDYPTSFHITPDPSLEKAVVSGLDLNVYLHGAYSDSGYIGNSGASYLTVGGYTAAPDRSVQVSVDDPTFANPMAASLNSSLDAFKLNLQTAPLTVGRHTIYVRAVQGLNTSPTASTWFRLIS
jgi:hypothetical protein